MLKHLIIYIICAVPAMAQYAPQRAFWLAAPYYPVLGPAYHDVSLMQYNPCLPALAGGPRTAGMGGNFGCHLNGTDPTLAVYDFYTDTYKSDYTWGIGLSGTKIPSAIGTEFVKNFYAAGGYKNILFGGLGLKYSAFNPFNFDLGAAFRYYRGTRQDPVSFSCLTILSLLNIRPTSIPMEIADASGNPGTLDLEIPFTVLISSHAGVNIRNILFLGAYISFSYYDTVSGCSPGAEIRLFNALGYAAYQVTNYDEGREYYSWRNEVMLQYNSKRLAALQDKPYDIHLRISAAGSYLSFSTVVYYTW